MKNLNDNEELANKTLRAFTEAALKVSPTGKQNSFASRAYASWALAEKGTDQPRSLAAAFYEPINGTDQLNVAVKPPSHELPSRSALLGLLAAALGIRRDEEERLNAFNRHYQFLLCASGNPRWARDYHTVQMPKEVRKARYFSRREELQDPELLSALISRRDYYTDAWWMIAVSATPDAPYTLAQLQTSLQHPVFPLYLGRKSHPLEQWLFGERSVNQGPWLRKEDACISQE